VTLGEWKYRLVFDVTYGGNRRVLPDADLIFELLPKDIFTDDCGDVDFVMTDEEGVTCGYCCNASDLDDLIIGIELIDFREKKEAE
jgi:hypothetical protein